MFFILTCTWGWWGKEVQWTPPAPFSFSNIYAITILNMVHNQYHQRKYIEKMKPRECGRALKYNICEGKNGRSLLPKNRYRQPAAVTTAQSKYFTNHTTKGTKILCRMDFNRKGSLKSQGTFPNKSQLQLTNTRKTNKPTPGPSLPNPTSKQTCTHTHTLTPHTPPNS